MAEPEVPLPLEPYRIKVVEPIARLDRTGREAALERAGFNLFQLRSSEVFIDLLTDSGTSAMSDRQWGALLQGDESYAGSRNYEHLESTVRDLTGLPEVVPVHQGRAGEHLLMEVLVPAGSIVPNNMHFDTTRAHVENRGAKALDLPCPEAMDLRSDAPFKGNMDLQALRGLLEGPDRRKVPLVLLTITNNTGGGQPVSLENAQGVSTLCRKAGVPLFLDICRWAENAFLVREREPGQGSRSIPQIGRSFFDLADGVNMSAKKDGLVNMGGFLATRDPALAARLRERLILYEGFPTYGGLARRDLEAMAVGLREATDLEYLRHRVGQVRYLAGLLEPMGVPFVRPVGGHGVYLDAKGFLPHLEDADLPGQALCVELYREGGVRSVEIGPVMFGEEDAPGAPRLPPLVRLAIPRRVYTASHLAYVAETVRRVWSRRDEVAGLRMVDAPAHLRHFLARFAPAPPASPGASTRTTP
jgi:tyrosine phenol-lyase